MARVLKVGMRDSLSRISIAVSVFWSHGLQRLGLLERKNEERDYYISVVEGYREY